MKIIVTGACGQLGTDVCNSLKVRGHSVIPTDLCDLDITDSAAVASFFELHSPDAVIHCAAYTAVDKAESDRDTCIAVNEKGTENIALSAQRHGAKMLYVSTDYVYGSNSLSPVEVTEAPNPLNVYGLSKLGGEVVASKRCSRLFIVRTSWVFGKNGNNFVKTMLRLGKEHPSLRVVCDQVGSPTYTVDLASLICDMIVSEKYGTYNVTNEDFCSWYDFAVEIFRRVGCDTEVIPVTTKEYSSVAVRPKNSRLSKKALDDAGFHRLPSWKDALGRFLSEI